MKPRKASANSKARKTTNSMKSTKTKPSSTVSSSYKTGMMKKTRSGSKPGVQKVKTAKSANGAAPKRASLTKNSNNPPFEYIVEESDREELHTQPLEPKFSNYSEQSEIEVLEKPKRNKQNKRKIDPTAQLIDRINEVIQSKGEFKLEDLTPEQQEIFTKQRKVVNKMKGLGIEPPRVNLLEESTGESDDGKQKLPGNNKVKEKFGRQNRYGVFGDNNWDKMVELYYNDPRYKKPEVNSLFHIEPYNERFNDLDDQVLNFVNLAEKQKQQNKLAPKQDKLKVEEYEEDWTDEHLKYEKKLKEPKPVRTMIYSKESDPKKKDLPGVVNSQKKIDEIKFMQVKRRNDAALRIQRWFRGYKARKLFKIMVQKKNIQDEEDYGYFEVTEQGVRQFLDDRRRKIEDERLRKQAIRDLSPEKDVTKDRFLMHDLRNESDELNIFNIYYNKLNGKDPFATPEKSMMTMAETPTKSRSIKRKQAVEKYNADLRVEEASVSLKDSIRESISANKFPAHKSKHKRLPTEEDGYSEDFEEDSIKESIVGGSGSARKLDHFRSTSEISESIHGDRTYNKKELSVVESIEEDIPEESIVGKNIGTKAGGKTEKRRSKQYILASSESIREEISGSGKFTPRIKESIAEEIEGSDNYSENFESLSRSQGKQDALAKSKLSQFKPSKSAPVEESKQETKDDIILRRQLEKKYGLDVPDRAENLIFDLINAKEIYEQSSTAMHMIDKFERMLALQQANNALAQEKLRHLEHEKRMKDELDKVREQQIAELVGALLSNKSDLDSKQIKSIISKQPLSKEVQEQIKGKVDRFEIEQTHKRSPPKKLRFEHHSSEAEDSADFIDTKKGAPQSKAISMFSKAHIKRSRPLTPKEQEIDLNDRLEEKRQTLESVESVPYSEDFEHEESRSVSKPRSALLKSKSEIDEDIGEDYDDKAETVKDTITEKIGEDYSMTFEDISESIVQSKNLKNKVKPTDSKNRLNSKYSASKISEEESIQEDIEESLPVKFRDRDDGDHSSSSNRLKKIQTKPERKAVSKPEIGSKKHKEFPQNKLLEKLQESSMNDFIKTLEKGVDAQYKDELNALVKEFSNNKISDREYAQKKKVLEAWKEKEIKDINKKRLLIEGWVQMSEIVAKMKTDDESANLSSGSIKDLRKAPKHLFTKPDYSKAKDKGSDDSEFNAEDDSDDSIKLRLAKKQLRDIANYEDVSDSAKEDIVDEADITMRKKSTKKKKLAASKLLEEKEKAIQEGLRLKMVELEEKHAQQLLEEALKVDVKKEIQRRFDLMLEFDNEQKLVRKRNEELRQRRLEESIEDSSMGYSFRPAKATDKDSIDASHQQDIEESAKSVAKIDTKPPTRNRNVLIKQAVSKDDTIHEDTIHESIDDYSNDFGSISQSASNLDVKLLKKPEEKPQVPEIKEEEKDEESEIPSEIDEDYSVDFEESANSSHLAQSIKSLAKNKEVKPTEPKVKDEIKEEASEEEDEQESVKGGIREKRKGAEDKIDSKSGSIIDETPIDSENESESQSHDEIIQRIPTGKSDDYIQKITDSASSADLEVLDGSHKSVEWVMEVPIEKPDEKLKTIEEEKSKEGEKKKPITPPDEIDEEYEEDFEDFSEASDRESTPRVAEKEVDIMDDHEKLADIIAEELFKSIDSAGLFDRTKKMFPPRDFKLEDFHNKFPFVKPDVPKSDKKIELQTQIMFFKELADEILKPHNIKQIIRSILEPKSHDMLDELRKLRVTQDDDEFIEAGDEEYLISEEIFNRVNSANLRKLKDVSKDNRAQIEAHNRALYEAFNETFSKMIPSGLKSNPLA